MRSLLKIVIPALQTPSPGYSVEALRAEVVKEQSEGRLLPQQVVQPAANVSASATSSETPINSE